MMDLAQGSVGEASSSQTVRCRHGCSLPAVGPTQNVCIIIHVYNASSQVMALFDDAKLFGTKGMFVKNYGLRKCAAWEVAASYDDVLIEFVREGGGY